MSDDRAAILWLIRIMAIRGNENFSHFAINIPEMWANKMVI